MNILDSISKTNLQYDDLIEILFKDYEVRKKNETLYSEDDFIPQNLINIYFGSIDHQDFKRILYNFKRKYLYNENELENVHNPLERDGLSTVYDYIMDDTKDNCPNIYALLKLHTLLYSKVPYASFGGKFRNSSACISGSDVKTTEPENIAKEIAALYPVYQKILELSKVVQETGNTRLLISYIDKCIELKCRLIEIHPFQDGNGRTCRALVNLLFRKINLPPVYIRNAEKKEYIKAMDSAIRLKDTLYIKRFYYYKICDSIYELDIRERGKKEEKGKIK